MFKQTARKASVFLSIFSLWIGLFAAIPNAARAQASDDAKKPKQEKASKKSAPVKASTEKTPTAQPADTTKALGVKDDPTQIGKRKINNGSDKLFGWLGGSQEKEMAIGRQLALQVEQQAKLVEDPIITEYVNRVGQNVVLHSDAKVRQRRSQCFRTAGRILFRQQGPHPRCR
jgi:hypothetical protein